MIFEDPDLIENVLIQGLITTEFYYDHEQFQNLFKIKEGSTINQDELLENELKNFQLLYEFSNEV